MVVCMWGRLNMWWVCPVGGAVGSRTGGPWTATERRQRSALVLSRCRMGGHHDFQNKWTATVLLTSLQLPTLIFPAQRSATCGAIMLHVF
jgi:hypothetical protein